MSQNDFDTLERFLYEIVLACKEGRFYSGVSRLLRLSKARDVFEEKIRIHLPHLHRVVFFDEFATAKEKNIILGNIR